MFEIDKKNFKKGRKPGILLIIIGLIFLLIFGGIEYYYISKKNSMDRETTATSFDENGYYDDENTYVYKPTFYYTVKGQEYSCTSGSSSSLPPSEGTTVYYKSSDPSNCITSYETSFNWIIFIFAGVGILILGIGIFMLIKNKKAFKKAKLLTTNGKLIKGLPYYLEGTNTYINGQQVQKLVVDYEAPNGLTVHLVGNSRYDMKTSDNDGLVDLLIDPNDLSNYYIDFDIKYTEGAPVEFYNKANTVASTPTEVTLQQVQQANNYVEQNQIPQPVPQQPVQNNFEQPVPQPNVNNQMPQQAPEANNDLNSFLQTAPVENNNVNNN